MKYGREYSLNLLESKRFLIQYHLDMKAPADECWLWDNSLDKLKYGIVSLGKDESGKHMSMNAHRFIYLLFVGPIPEGFYCLHKCDNRPCCNPSHLFLGTQKDNMQDMDNKGRGVRRRK